jgi:hypothetical protein
LNDSLREAGCRLGEVVLQAHFWRLRLENTDSMVSRMRALAISRAVTLLTLVFSV